ncbi:MAG TPA: hypothetical protein PKD00_01485 [Burkholderiales bacterium]|nr:hypothetical protein [Burkholderiales bacterium]
MNYKITKKILIQANTFGELLKAVSEIIESPNSKYLLDSEIEVTPSIEVSENTLKVNESIDLLLNGERRNQFIETEEKILEEEDNNFLNRETLESFI